MRNYILDSYANYGKNKKERDVNKRVLLMTDDELYKFFTEKDQEILEK
jgi:hypothetical protein